VTLSIGEKFDCTIEKVVYGGHGFVRVQGWVVFIVSNSGIISGEKVRACITRKQGSFFWAEVLELLDPSPSRITPKCPYFGSCGGCQLQHISQDEQQSLKTQWLNDQLLRALGPVQAKVISPKTCWNWRRRIFLHARCTDSGWQIGYFEKDNKTLFMPEICPIFSENKEIFAAVRDFFLKLKKQQGKSIEVCIGKIGLDQYGLFLHVTGNLENSFDKAIAHFSKSFISISIHGKDKSFQHGPQTFSEEILNSTIFYTLSAFLQNHPEAYSLILNSISARMQKPPLHVYDLYSGVGCTTCLLKRLGYTVESIEYNRKAVACAEMALEKNNLTADGIHCGKVEEMLPNLKMPASIWIVNPPREGLHPKVIELCIKQRPQELFYTSCHLATMIRDIKPLLEAGWKIAWIQGFDLFPQTTHLEVVCQLILTN